MAGYLLMDGWRGIVGGEASVRMGPYDTLW
jgi:hypothetical protein